MKTYKFIYQSQKGIIEVSEHGTFVQWSTLSCQIEALRGGLLNAVNKAIGA